VTDGKLAEQPHEMGEALATALGCVSFVAVPFRYGSEAVGRVFVTSGDPRAFNEVDIEVLGQVLEQVAPVLENIRLVDRLASDAAGEERQRIGRDLHDSMIQPYIGLRIGLSAARQAFETGQGADGIRLLDRLAVITETEIENFRGYVRKLKSERAGAGHEVLPQAVRRFCERFREATGIQVEVGARGSAALSDRVSAEAFQMIAEALSNIRRHTDAERAAVHIDVDAAQLRLRIQNDGTPPEANNGFTPKSLLERTAALGGTLDMRETHKGTTELRIDIPL
jgi:signal transduction histidine kinase